MSAVPNPEPQLILIQDVPFLFRPAQLSDGPAVAALSAQIWEGDDYVPHVFEEWVADERGEFTVVYDGERLAGFGKLTELGPAEWWLEGLRVDPVYRGRGVARAMHQYAVELFDRIGRGMLRLATEAKNRAIQKISGESGFRLVSQHLMAEAEARPEGNTADLAAVTAGERPALLAWLENSPVYQGMSGLIEDEWVWLEAPPRLAGWLEQGRVFWWQDRAGLIITRLAEPELLWLNFIDGPADQLPAILAAVQAQAVGRGASKIESKPLATPTMGAALAAAGWQVGEYEMRLYERPKR